MSYDNAVSDDSQAEQLFAKQVEAADLPEPVASESASSPSSSSSSAPGSGSPSGASSSGSPAATPSGSAPSGDASSGPSGSATPTDLQPRLLDDLGDEGYVDDELSDSGSTAKQRTVTVAFRTSNVMVTIEYAEQSATLGVVPDSEEMQDMARKLASQLADSLGG